MDNGITCCYWSASLSNRLRALKAHNSLFKCCAKNCPNYMYWIQGKHRGFLVWVFLQLSVLLKLIFIVPFNFYSISIFLFRGGGCHWQGTASGPKRHIGRSKKWHWQGRKSHKGQNVTLECYNCIYSIETCNKGLSFNQIYCYICSPQSTVVYITAIKPVHKRHCRSLTTEYWMTGGTINSPVAGKGLWNTYAAS